MRIVCAAIKDKNGKVWLGKRHSNCFQYMAESGMKDSLGHKQGFMTNENTFVDRIEAMHIAVAAGQVDKGEDGRELFSEDIY